MSWRRFWWMRCVGDKVSGVPSSAMRFVVSLSIPALLACAGLFDPADTGGEGTDSENAAATLEQSEACAQYIECLTATAPDAVGPALSAYGEDGSCWTTQSSADACDEACQEALSNAFDLYPEESACSDGSTPEIQLDYDNWLFDETKNNCDDDFFVYQFEAQLSPDSETFQFHGLVTLRSVSGSTVEEYGVQVSFACQTDGFDFACDDVFSSLITEDDLTLSFSGTFAEDLQSATAKAGLEIDQPATTCTATLSGEVQ